MATLHYYTLDNFLLPSIFVCLSYGFVVKLFGVNNSILLQYYNTTIPKFKKQIFCNCLLPIFFICFIISLPILTRVINFDLFSFFLIVILGLAFLGVNLISKSDYIHMYDSIVPMTLPFLLYFILFSSNFVQFILLIEIIGYTFYFQFFNVSGTKIAIKFMDLILYYYWSSFLGTILLFITIQQLLLNYNTCDFIELSQLFSFYQPELIITLFLFFGLLFKLGAIGIHFLKSDFYKYLSIIALFNFSVISTFVYLYIYAFVLISSNFFINAIFVNLVIAFLVVGLLFFSANLKFAQNITLLFGYSAALTVSTLLLLLL